MKQISLQQHTNNSPCTAHYTILPVLDTTQFSLYCTLHNSPCTAHYTILHVLHTKQFSLYCTLHNSPCTAHFTILPVLDTTQFSRHLYSRHHCTIWTLSIAHCKLTAAVSDLQKISSFPQLAFLGKVLDSAFSLACVEDVLSPPEPLVHFFQAAPLAFPQFVPSNTKHPTLFNNHHQHHQIMADIQHKTANSEHWHTPSTEHHQPPLQQTLENTNTYHLTFKS